MASPDNAVDVETATQNEIPPHDVERPAADISDGVVKLSVQEGARIARLSRSETPVSSLAPFHWDDLDRRYDDAMKGRDEIEAKINQDFRSMVEIYDAWAQTASLHESERAQKRLRTRVSYVQTSETKVAKKKEHYEQVVNAFKSAMELLANLDD